VGDLDGDEDVDMFSCEMEAVPGDRPPRWYIWENVDGRGEVWRGHVILDANLRGHEAVVGDVTGNGLPDIIAKPWALRRENALGGKMFIFFEYMSDSLNICQRPRSLTLPYVKSPLLTLSRHGNPLVTNIVTRLASHLRAAMRELRDPRV